MKAVHFTTYGAPGNLQLVEVGIPVPHDDEVLVRVHAASINISNWYTVRGGPTRLFNGLLRPKDPRCGTDLAGTVESIGSQVTKFQPGDRVFGCAAGSFAEYAAAKEKKLARMPANVSFEQAAAVPVAATTALQGLRDAGRVQRGQKVLINGASGGVGTFAVQIAKAFGANVTAVCSTPHLEAASAMGADHVIDYTREEFTCNGQSYDLILAVNGYRPYLACRRALAPKGAYIMVGAAASLVMLALAEAAVLGPFVSRAGGQRLAYMGLAKINQADLLYLSHLLETGVITPLIERKYPLSDTAQALRHIGQGHACGKIVITLSANSTV
jgi:NADPH:quinone reductase-like Zn-dependent oxidoreductase